MSEQSRRGRLSPLSTRSILFSLRPPPGKNGTPIFGEKRVSDKEDEQRGTPATFKTEGKGSRECVRGGVAFTR